MAGKGAVIMIDPKGDRALFARAATEAHRCGKPFAMFLAAFPSYSASFNPLGSAETPLEIADRIQALTPNSRDPFFVGFSLAFVTRIAEAQQKLGIPWTLHGLYEASVLRHRMEELIERYLLSLGCYRPGKLEGLMLEYEKKGLHDDTAEALINYARWPREHYQKVTGTLIPTFHGVVNGSFAHLLSPAHPDLTWRRIVREGMVVYVGLASMMFKEVANRVARTFVQDLLGFLGRRYAYEDPDLMSPVTVPIDEFGDVVYPGIVDALNKARGANTRFILAMQSRADVTSKLGKDEAPRVFKNMSHCWFRLADDAAGETSLTEQTYAIHLPERPAVGLGYGGVGGLTGHTQTHERVHEVPVVRAEFLKALPTGEAFLSKAGILWKLRVPLLTPVPKAVLDALGLTAMWEAMDPNRVYEGDLCTTDPAPTVPPARWLPAPAPASLPLPGARLMAPKSTSAPCWNCTQALRRVWKFVKGMGRRPVQP